VNLKTNQQEVACLFSEVHCGAKQLHHFIFAITLSNLSLLQ